MSFVIPWLWYLLAFIAGSLVAWGVALALVKPTMQRRDGADE